MVYTKATLFNSLHKNAPYSFVKGNITWKHYDHRKRTKYHYYRLITLQRLGSVFPRK
jgi:hypothetical protein